MPRGIPLTQEELIRKQREIITANTRQFVQEGFHDTSMEKIALAAGIGKSTLYDYFKTKDEILIFMVEEEVNTLTQRAQAVLDQPLCVIDKLYQIMNIQLEFLSGSKALYRRLASEILRLRPESQQRIQVKRYAYQDLIRGLVEQGIREGVFRKVDPLLAARLLYTTLSPIIFTSRPSDTPQTMMENAFDILLYGIRFCPEKEVTQ